MDEEDCRIAAETSNLCVSVACSHGPKQIDFVLCVCELCCQYTCVGMRMLAIIQLLCANACRTSLCMCVCDFMGNIAVLLAAAAAHTRRDFTARRRLVQLLRCIDWPPGTPCQKSLHTRDYPRDALTRHTYTNTNTPSHLWAFMLGLCRLILMHAPAYR